MTDWHSLGVQLEIKYEDLAKIEKDYGNNTKRCKTEVVQFWCRNSLDRTWDRLADAVSLMGDHENLAKTLRKNCQG